MVTTGTLPSMGRRKKTDTPAGDGGKHKTPRRNLGLPEDWFLLAQRLARRDKPTPTMWWIVSLIEEAAKAAGEKELPPRPWERDDA